jgi:hypothetical protein
MSSADEDVLKLYAYCGKDAAATFVSIRRAVRRGDGGDEVCVEVEAVGMGGEARRRAGEGGGGSIGDVERAVKCIESMGGEDARGSGPGAEAGEIGGVSTAVLIICIDRVGGGGGGGGEALGDDAMTGEMGAEWTLESLM